VPNIATRLWQNVTSKPVAAGSSPAGRATCHLPKVTARTQERSVANQTRRIQRQIKAAIKKPKAGAKAKPGASEDKRDLGKPASRLIDQRIRDLGGWRGEALARMRALILEADPEMIEDCKWIKPTNPLGVPVWSHDGIVCTGEAYAKVVKLTFARGASIPDPSRLFNSSLEGNTRRAIDIREGEKVDAGAFKALVKAAAAQNGPPTKKR
jgi:hypothetical protein